MRSPRWGSHHPLLPSSDGWQSGTDGSSQRGKGGERRNLCLIEGIGVRLGASSPRTKLPPWHFYYWRPCQKGQMVVCKAGHGRSFSPWVTSQCPVTQMKGSVLLLHSQAFLGPPRDMEQASPRPGTDLVHFSLIHSPQNFFSGIYYYYYKDP